MEQDRFAAIRPYHDAEVRGVLDRLLQDPELISAITRLRLPRLASCLEAMLRPIVVWVLRRQVAHIHTVREFQAVVEKYMTRMIEASTEAFTVSGIETIDPRTAYLFIGNHRDIALDPAFLSYALYANGQETVRIAIGDNLLTKPYTSDLMRLNKSFIVRRSAKGPRQMLAAYQELSAYIHHSLIDEHSSIWIAQREGRAKDGWDRTEPAIIKMLCIGKPKQQALGEYIRAMNILPVAISYEWDPCDAIKARELYLRDSEGKYEKAAHEDVRSIARSITSPKGEVHVAFGEPLSGDFASVEEVAAEVDRQIMGMYSIHASNLAAYRLLHRSLPQDFADGEAIDEAERVLQARLAALPEAHRPYLLRMYANPLLNRAGLSAQVVAAQQT